MTATIPTPAANSAANTAPSSAADTAASTTPDPGSTGASDPGLFAAPLRRAVGLVGGLAMIATPLLLVGGILTSPPQDSRATSDYIESLARDPQLSAVSASLLHYGWVAMALGLVVAMTLVRGRKGRVLTLVGGLAGGFFAVQMSALMLNDWFLIALGTNLPMDDGVRVAEAMMLHGGLLATIWWKCATAAIAVPVLLYAGLARAGVISWWLVPLSLFGMVAPYVVMGLVGGATGALVGGNALGLVAGGIVGLVCYAPTFVVGLRLISRSRLAA